MNLREQLQLFVKTHCLMQWMRHAHQARRPRLPARIGMQVVEKNRAGHRPESSRLLRERFLLLISLRRSLQPAKGRRQRARQAKLGVLYMGAEASTLRRNDITDNGLAGIALADACLALAGSPLDCSMPNGSPPEFFADQDATHIKVVANRLRRNGLNAPAHPFAFAVSDLALLSYGEGNCFARNEFDTAFSLPGTLPACR